PGAVYQADGYIQLADELAREEVADRREVARRLRRGRLPGAARDVLLRPEVDRLLDLEMPDPRKLRRGDLGLGVARVAQGPLDVRLAAGDPDVADQRVAH